MSKITFNVDEEEDPARVALGQIEICLDEK